MRQNTSWWRGEKVSGRVCTFASSICWPHICIRAIGVEMCSTSYYMCSYVFTHSDMSPHAIVCVRHLTSQDKISENTHLHAQPTFTNARCIWKLAYVFMYLHAWICLHAIPSLLGVHNIRRKTAISHFTTTGSNWNQLQNDVSLPVAHAVWDHVVLLCLGFEPDDSIIVSTPDHI